MTAPRRQLLFLVLLVVAATTLRLAYAYWVHAPGRSVISDMAAYHRQARHLLDGTLGPDDTFYPIGYPALIAAAYRISSSSLGLLAVVQAIAGGLTCLMAYLVARRFALPAAWALAAAAIVAAYPPFVFYGSLLLTEAITPLLFTLMIWLLVRVIETRHWRWAAALGVTFAAASLVRTNFLPFAPVVALCVWTGVGRRWRAAVWPLSVAAASAIPLLAVACTLNSSLTGRWAGPSTNGGVNFFMMHAEVGRVRYYDWSTGPVRNQLEYSGVYESPVPFYDEPHFYREGVALMLADPLRAAFRAADGLRETAGLGRQSYWPNLRLPASDGWRGDVYALLGRALRFSALAFLFVLVLPPAIVIAILSARGTIVECGQVVWMATAGALAVMFVTSVLFLAEPRMHVPYDALLIAASLAAVRRGWLAGGREPGSNLNRAAGNPQY